MVKGIIFGNRILDVAFVAWFIAQFYKVISTVIVDKKMNLKRIMETGGMPSSHSSTVCALTTSVAIVYGTQNPMFAMSLIFSVIIMYDAAGIRREAGTHAGLLNLMLDTLTTKTGVKLHDEKLKELLGHSPMEVLVGAILGVVVGFIFKGYLLV